MSKVGTKNARSIFVLQGVVTGLIALFFYLCGNTRASLSALFGGMTALLPMVVFAILSFRHRGARAAKTIVNYFYLAEGVKIVFSVVLFALVFRFYSVVPLVFFLVYMSIALSFGFLLLMLKKVKT